jgi:hypothetical protein
MIGRYTQLKREYQKSQELFRQSYQNEPELSAAIAVLARHKNDDGWPLGMLTALKPELARALEHWSAEGYEDIRHAQENEAVVLGSDAHNLQANFHLLPLWRGRAIHVSKDPLWFHRLRDERLTLKSFMSCCAPGHTFAYVSNPAATLVFTRVITGRLVGALTTENLEREILLPRGALFRVRALDLSTRTIKLTEIAR